MGCRSERSVSSIDPAVFGGFLSDTLLKGYHIYKLLYRKGGQPLFTHKDPIDSPLFTDSMLSEVNRRRSNHFAMVQNIRPRSVHEWFSMWPISMHSDISNLHSNRRLFRSYEPFMANTVVKLAAAVPQDWKRNRLLFHRMASPLFELTKQIPHPNGWMPFHQGWQPYSPWYDTCFTRPLVKAWRRNQKRMGCYQGTWCDWNTVMQSEAWKKTIEQYTAANNTLDRIFTTDVKQLLERSDSGLHTLQKVNLLQALLSFIKRH